MTLIAPLVSGVPVARAADADDRTPLRLPFSDTATPTFLNRTSLQLAELRVLRLESHTVKLRFTLAGTLPPMLAAPTSGPRGQAVLSVRVDLVRRLTRNDFKRGTT